MGHDVFISHAKEDRQYVEVICRTLERNGIRCWYAPRNVPLAMDFEKAITDAIHTSQVIVLIVSQHSNKSSHVRREIQNASAKELPILPIRVENVQLNDVLNYYLRSKHRLDAFTAPIESYMQSLVEHLRSSLNVEGKEGSEQLVEDRGESGVDRSQNQFSTEGVRSIEEGRESSPEEDRIASSGGEGVAIADPTAEVTLRMNHPFKLEKKYQRWILGGVLSALFSIIVIWMIPSNKGAITGRVTSYNYSDSGYRGLGDVDVKLIDPNNNLVQVETTGSDGTYTFDDLEPGNYVMRAQAKYRHPFNQPIRVDKGKTTTIDIRLEWKD